MKKSLLLVLLLLPFISLGQNSFGKTIQSSTDEMIRVEDLTKPEVYKSGNDVLVGGEVESVCQVKGCWMKLKLNNGETIRVTFKDYGFFVPKDLSGSTILMEGKPEVKVTTVEELKHYAEDAGESSEEIAKIKNPKREVTFVATGVKVVPVKKGTY